MQHPNDPQIERIFTYHAPKPSQPEIYTRVRDQAKRFAYLIQELCPECDERRLALNHLEIAVFWINAALGTADG
jgi:hypothetical protein